MASLLSKVARFATSPAGRRAFHEAKRLAKDPHTRKQAKEALDRVRNKGQGRGDTHGGSGTGDGR